jgi:hypothetical protein
MKSSKKPKDQGKSLAQFLPFVENVIDIREKEVWNG